MSYDVFAQARFHELHPQTAIGVNVFLVIKLVYLEVTLKARYFFLTSVPSDRVVFYGVGNHSTESGTQTGCFYAAIWPSVLTVILHMLYCHLHEILNGDFPPQ